jgi:hypothetical protein
MIQPNERLPLVLMRRQFLCLLLAALLAAPFSMAISQPVHAEDDGGGNDDSGSDDNDGGDEDESDDEESEESEQDEALKVRQSGNALPVGEIIALLKKKIGGEVVDIRLVQQSPATYDVKMLSPEGRIGTVRVAAKPFKIIRMSGY